jgi:hypothetical protein
LRPADDVRSEEVLAGGEDVEVGETAELEGVMLSVSAMTVDDSDSLGPMVRVDVRSENPTSEELANPTLAIYCTGDPEGGGWQADSTWRFRGPLPAGTFDEGFANLLLPGDSRTGNPVPVCQTPAYLHGWIFQAVTFDADPAPFAQWRVPDELIDNMNAAALEG